MYLKRYSEIPGKSSILTYSPTDKCYDLICKMLALNPLHRSSCEELLKHDFFTEEPEMNYSQLSTITQESHEFHMRMNMDSRPNIVSNNATSSQQIANQSYNIGTEENSFLGNKRGRDD